MRRYHPSLRLLAIAPGSSQYLGVAVFEDMRLLDWRVKRLAPELRQPTQLVHGARWVLRPLVQRYAPQVLATLHGVACRCRRCRQGTRVQKLAAALQRVGHQLGLRVVVYPPEQVRRFTGGGQPVTRMELARILATQSYPFLAPHYERERRKAWFRQPYQLWMFEAVALGRYALQRMPGQPQGEASPHVPLDDHPSPSAAPRLRSSRHAPS